MSHLPPTYLPLRLQELGTTFVLVGIGHPMLGQPVANTTLHLLHHDDYVGMDITITARLGQVKVNGHHMLHRGIPVIDRAVGPMVERIVIIPSEPVPTSTVATQTDSDIQAMPAEQALCSGSADGIDNCPTDVVDAAPVDAIMASTDVVAHGPKDKAVEQRPVGEPELFEWRTFQ